MTEEKGEDKLVLLCCLEGWKSRVGEKNPGLFPLLFIEPLVIIVVFISFEALK